MKSYDEIICMGTISYSLKLINQLCFAFIHHLELQKLKTENLKYKTKVTLFGD